MVFITSAAAVNSFAGVKWAAGGGADPHVGSPSRYTRRGPLNPNVYATDKGSKTKEIIMVDPLEAKRLAAKQMEQIKNKDKFRKRRQIEAINGAWAMIGLTAGLVIEGRTGKPILSQLAGYWDSFWELLR
ncbi:hypothetical protein M569_05869 [Genlisea aurea]|uniref:Uncharacterized protein n=1 Tax=Genlisea aurea TaxID=192259 RepID=S8CQA0_9LAMI|nr:hypothetical protein M569_05869 [Genlisea aurea]